jgi:hypothetical protein
MHAGGARWSAGAGAAETWVAPSGWRERARGGARELAVWAGVERQAERSRGVGPVQACVCGSKRARVTREQALEQARCRCSRRRRVSAEAGPERRRTARSEQWHAGRIQTREQQRDAGQGPAQMEMRRGGSGQTHTLGNEAVHGSSLARTAAEGPAMQQGRSKRGTGNRRKRRSCA